jgi:hypothetical protein
VWRRIAITATSTVGWARLSEPATIPLAAAALAIPFAAAALGVTGAVAASQFGDTDTFAVAAAADAQAITATGGELRCGMRPVYRSHAAKVVRNHALPRSDGASGFVLLCKSRHRSDNFQQHDGRACGG